MLSREKLNLIVETKLKQALFESQESDSQKLAIKLVMDRYGWDKERANHFIRIDLRNMLPALRSKILGKFTLGAARMYCDGQLDDDAIKSKLNATLEIMGDYIDNFDKDLNNLSADALIEQFQDKINSRLDKVKQEVATLSFGKSDYQIIKINSFKEASEYAKFTAGKNQWCLTVDENLYNSYTRNGYNQLYFCFRNGFEKVRPKPQKTTPLDNYGLSLISVIVDSEGDLAFCTTRWNHSNGGTDHAMDIPQLSQVLNVNFFDVFKPAFNWREALRTAQEKIKTGETPETVFDEVRPSKFGLLIVMLCGKRNYMDKDGNFISKVWFDNTYGWHVDKHSDNSNAVAVIHVNGKYNILTLNGDFLSDVWFDFSEDFHDGYATVTLNGRENLINCKGEFFSKQWYRSVSPNISDGYLRVYSDDKNHCNFINEKGELLSKQWFDSARDFYLGLAEVKMRKGKRFVKNYLKTNGELLCDNWYDKIDWFVNGIAMVHIKRKVNFINTDGKLLCPKYWFDGALDFRNGYGIVQLGKKFNILCDDGEFLSEQWFDQVYDFKDGVAKVYLNGKYGYIDTYGRLEMDESKMRKQTMRLTENDLKYIIDETLRML